MPDSSVQNLSTLILLARSGDDQQRRDALTLLLDRVEDIVRFAVFQVLTSRRPEIDHEEVVQMALIAFIDSLERLKNDRSLPTYAFAIATNQARQFLTEESRLNKLRGYLCEHKIDFAPPSMPPRADLAIIGKNLIVTLADALEQVMSSQEQRIFNVIYADQMSVKEAAKLTGLTQEHVRQIQYQIRKKARSILHELGHNSASMDLGSVWN